MELKEATVMVVDDEPMLLEIFGEWLQRKNWPFVDGWR